MPATKKTNKKKTTKSKNNVKSFGPQKLKFNKLSALILIILIAVVGSYVLFRSHAASNTTYNLNSPPVGIVNSGANDGYWIGASDGGVFSQGSAIFYNSMGGSHLNAPVVAIANTPDNRGYYLLGADGAVFAFGDAQYVGAMNCYPYDSTGCHGSINIPGNVVGIAAHNGGGYWVITSTGATYAFGAPYFGNVNGSSGVVGISPSASGNGYYAVSNTGQGYQFGDAGGIGNLGGVSDIVGVVSAGPGRGCWMVGADGGVFAFNAPYYGSMGGQHLNAPVVGITHSGDYNGYWLVASDGGVFSFGDATYQGRVVYNPPTDNITTNFPTIQRGQKSTINWGSTNATSVSITNIGAVNPVAGGMVWVTPQVTTTYTISAVGPAGSAQPKSVTITVIQPPPPPPPPQATNHPINKTITTGTVATGNGGTTPIYPTPNGCLPGQNKINGVCIWGSVADTNGGGSQTQIGTNGCPPGQNKINGTCIYGSTTDSTTLPPSNYSINSAINKAPSGTTVVNLGNGKTSNCTPFLHGLGAC